MRWRITVLWGVSFTAGLALLLPAPWWVFIIWLFPLMETAHAIAPIALGWTELRQKMMGNPLWSIIAPLVLIAATFELPWSITVAGHPYPFLPLIWSVVNGWHFGMQNFGVLRLMGVKIHRGALQCIVVAATMGGAYLPFLFLPRWEAFLVTSLVSVNHWITDLGLTKMASVRGWLMLGLLLAAGCMGYGWYHLTLNGAVKSGEIGIRAAYALGFVHFLYSRLVWQHGRELLGAAHGDDILMVDSTIRLAR